MEHRFPKPGVVGSNPAGRTTRIAVLCPETHVFGVLLLETGGLKLGRGKPDVVNGMARERRTNDKHNLPPGVERIRDKYLARLPRPPGDPGSGRYRKGSPTADLWRAAKEAQEARERYDKAMAGHKVPAR